MPVVEKENDRQQKRHKVPQYLKTIHDATFQSNAAEKTKKICERAQNEFALSWRVSRRVGTPIAMQMTVTDRAPTKLDLASSYWLDSYFASRLEIILLS